MKKRIISIIAAMAILMALLPQLELTVSAAGDITSISTAKELQQLASEVNAGTDYAGKTITLTADIDLSSVCSSLLGTWTPIGTYNSTASKNKPFNGTFDGNGHTISGLYIYSQDNCAALFGNVGKDGIVTNLTVSGTVYNTKYYTSGIAAYNDGTINDCVNNASITINGGQYNGWAVGGIAAYSTGVITDCQNKGAISGDGQTIGGITGNNYKGTVTGCSNTASVTGASYVGGICGGNSGTTTKCYNKGEVTCTGVTPCGGISAGNSSGANITYCYNTAAVKCAAPSTTSSTNNMIGGIAGDCSGAMTQCYSTGNVTGTQRVGAMCGKLSTSGSVTLCYYLKTSSVNSELYGVAYNGSTKLTADTAGATAPLASTNAFAVKTNFSGWDFSDIWTIGETAQRPVLLENNEDALFKGKGTEASPYIIPDLDALKKLSASVNSGEEYSGVYFKLVNDITLDNAWTAIGTNNYWFSGYFDGDYHTISGFDDTTALFNTTASRVKISKLTVDGGAIVATNRGKITDCLNAGEGGYIVKQNAEDVSQYALMVERCYSNGSIYGSTGGTAAYCYAKSNPSIASDLTTGRYAYMLQSYTNSDTLVWGQTVGSDYPILTRDASKRVYTVDFMNNEETNLVETKYANSTGLTELPSYTAENSNYVFAYWTDDKDTKAEYTVGTALTSDTVLYAVGEEKYDEKPETDGHKITVSYGTLATKDLSEYVTFATTGEADGTETEGNFTYTITDGNTALGASVSGDTLTIPNNAPAGTYTLTIKAVKKASAGLTLMSLGNSDVILTVTVEVSRIKESIVEELTINYENETIGTLAEGTYIVGVGDEKFDVAVENGTLPVQNAYMGKTISISKKASDANHDDSDPVQLAVPERLAAPSLTNENNTTPASYTGISDGTITGVDETMEYKFGSGEWTDVTGDTITGLPDTYTIRKKATSNNFASDTVQLTIGARDLITVTFKDGDGQIIDTQQVVYGTTPSYKGENTPTKTHTEKYTYEFNNEWLPILGAVTETAEYIAQFNEVARSYTVTLHENGGTITGDFDSYTYGTGLTLPTAEQIAKDGSIFVGWYDSDNFENEAVTAISADATGDKEYYAQWKINSTTKTEVIDNSGGSAKVEIENLERIAEELAENIEGDVEVVLEISNENTDSENAEQAAIEAIKTTNTVEYYDIVLLVNTEKQATAPEAISIKIPYDTTRVNITVYRYNSAAEAKTAVTLKEKSTAADGEEYFEVTDGYVTIHTNNFGAYAIGYDAPAATLAPRRSSGGSSRSKTTPTPTPTATPEATEASAETAEPSETPLPIQTETPSDDWLYIDVPETEWYYEPVKAVTV